MLLDCYCLAAASWNPDDDAEMLEDLLGVFQGGDEALIEVASEEEDTGD
ncbi:MAG: hypothetical protein IPK75_17955 [Acidobacteria bacterium]|nr:hypothetical protein [Acidobacteriota bacterium]